MSDLLHANRIVIKAGSAILTHEETGELRGDWLETLVSDINALIERGKEVVLVTSGSVSLGRAFLGLHKKVLKIEEKQAAAACGQVELIKHYQHYFANHGLKIGQLLLTIHDSGNRRHYLNAKNTMEALIKHKIVPIINENDTVATNELRFGDNDRLAARVAQMVSADFLVLLSDIDGLYTKNPQLHNDAKHIDRVEEITPEIEAMAGGAISAVGSGGMATKVEAAKMAISCGCHMYLTSGHHDHPIQRLLDGEKSTLFVSKDTPLSARKRWFAGALNITGEIIIDDGAVKALQNGRSLLPAGVVDIRGDFERGDAVSIRDCRLKEIARGLSAYDAKDARLIMGHQTNEIELIIGFSGRDELIHRNDLVLV